MIKSTNYSTYKLIVELLIQARKDKGMTIRQLADELEVDNTSVAKIENLRRKLGLGEYIQYCSALNTDPSQLIQLALEKEKNLK